MFTPKKICALIIISTALCSSAQALEAPFYAPSDDKYLSLSLYTGWLRYANTYGKDIFPTDTNGAEINLGLKVTKAVFVEGGISYGLQSTNKHPAARYIPGTGTNHLWDTSGMTSENRIYRTSLGLKMAVYTIPQINLGFILGGGLSYTTINASWDFDGVKSCIFNKTGITPYFKTGAEYKINNSTFIGVTYTYVHLASLGIITPREYQDNTHYFVNNIEITPMIKAQDLHAVALTYLVSF